MITWALVGRRLAGATRVSNLPLTFGGDKTHRHLFQAARISVTPASTAPCATGLAQRTGERTMDLLRYGVLASNHTASSGHGGSDKMPPSTPSGPTPTDHLTWGNVFIAFCFLGADAIISIYLHLGISRSLLIAALRCVTQLYIMSLILDRIFAAQSPWGVAAMVIVLNLLAAYEVTINKAKRRFEGMFIITLTSMAVSCVPCFAIASRFALNQDPWWVPAK